MIFFVT